MTAIRSPTATLMAMNHRAAGTKITRMTAIAAPMIRRIGSLLGVLSTSELEGEFIGRYPPALFQHQRRSAALGTARSDARYETVRCAAGSWAAYANHSQRC